MPDGEYSFGCTFLYSFWEVSILSEIGVPDWGCKFHLNQNINLLETVQKRATKQIPSIRHLPYSECLAAMGMDSLKLRHLATDFVNAHKVINHLTNSNLEHLFHLHVSNTRGHAYKVRKQHCSRDFRKHFFTLRIAETWNKLPAYVVGCRSTESFKASMLPVVRRHYT